MNNFILFQGTYQIYINVIIIFVEKNIMTDNNYGQYDIPLSHKRHKVIKITLPLSRIQCLKIFFFSPSRISRINLYKDHFEGVKEWLRMRYAGKSCLMTLSIIQTVEETHVIGAGMQKEEMFTLKVTTDYLPQPTLDVYYQKMEQKIQKNPFSRQIQAYLYYFQQFFEVILRGGSITNFFYTPNNLFINRPQQLVPDIQDSKISVNFLSTVGLELLFRKGDIIREDLYEIYPLLPTNLSVLMNDDGNYVKQLNKIIKMKALAWNIMAFILGYIPNLLKGHKLMQTIVNHGEVLKLLQLQLQLYKKLFANTQVKEMIQQAIKITGIDLNKFFNKVFIENCKNIDWEQIYNTLFLENKIAQNKKESYKNITENHQDQQKISQQILKSFWSIQQKQTQQFYLKRSINKASMVYFLIRSNISFRKMMQHLNVLYFCDKAGFSVDLLELHITFMKNSFKYTQKLAAKQKRIRQMKQNKQSQEQIAKLDKELQELKKLVFPYVDKINSYKKEKKEKGTSDYVSVKNMAFGLSRSILLKGVQVELNHEMLETLNKIRLSEWNHF